MPTNTPMPAATRGGGPERQRHALRQTMKATTTAVTPLRKATAVATSSRCRRPAGGHVVGAHHQGDEQQGGEGGAAQRRAGRRWRGLGHRGIVGAAGRGPAPRPGGARRSDERLRAGRAGRGSCSPSALCTIHSGKCAIPGRTGVPPDHSGARHDHSFPSPPASGAARAGRAHRRAAPALAQPVPATCASSCRSRRVARPTSSRMVGEKLAEAATGSRC